MKRGEIWSVAGGKNYVGKPRPAVILQDDLFDAIESVTICAFTTDPTPAPLFRIEVAPSQSNGLQRTSRLMVDKITTVPKARIGVRIGVLDEADGARLDRAVLVFWGWPLRGAAAAETSLPTFRLAGGRGSRSGRVAGVPSACERACGDTIAVHRAG